MSLKSIFPRKVSLEDNAVLVTDVKHLLYFQGTGLPGSSRGQPLMLRTSLRERRGIHSNTCPTQPAGVSAAKGETAES